MKEYILIGIVVYAVIGLVLNLWHTFKCGACRSNLHDTKHWALLIVLCMLIGVPWMVLQAYAKIRGIEGRCE